MILDETYNFLQTRYSDQISNLKIEEVRMGAHLTAVRLSDNSYGVASTMSDNQDYCVKCNRDFGDFTPTKVGGQKVTLLFETTKKSNIIDTLRIAVLNAISSTILSNGNYKIVENADPIDLIDLNSKKKQLQLSALFNHIFKKYRLQIISCLFWSLIKMRLLMSTEGTMFLLMNITEYCPNQILL